MFQNLNEFPFQTSASLTYVTLAPKIEKKNKKQAISTDKEFTFS